MKTKTKKKTLLSEYAQRKPLLVFRDITLISEKASKDNHNVDGLFIFHKNPDGHELTPKDLVDCAINRDKLKSKILVKSMPATLDLKMGEEVLRFGEHRPNQVWHIYAVERKNEIVVFETYAWYDSMDIIQRNFTDKVTLKNAFDLKHEKIEYSEAVSVFQEYWEVKDSTNAVYHVRKTTNNAFKKEVLQEYFDYKYGKGKIILGKIESKIDTGGFHSYNSKTMSQYAIHVKLSKENTPTVTLADITKSLSEDQHVFTNKEVCALVEVGSMRERNSTFKISKEGILTEPMGNFYFNKGPFSGKWARDLEGHKLIVKEKA